MLLPLRCVAFVSVSFALMLVTGCTVRELAKWWPAILIAVNFYCIYRLWVVSEGSFSQLLNFKKEKIRLDRTGIVIAVTLLAGLVSRYAAAYLVYSSFSYHNSTLTQPLPIFVAVICALLLPITTTLAEGGIYLGAIHGVNGEISVTLGTAFFYGAQYCVLPFIPDLRFHAYRFLCFAPLGLIVCLWYRKVRDPLPFLAGHFMLSLATAAEILSISFFP